jgi:hypothetical protein
MSDGSAPRRLQLRPARRALDQLYRRHLPHPLVRGDPRDLQRSAQNHWSAVESRKPQLPIDKVFAFDDIGKAFEHMEANQHLGKIAAGWLHSRIADAHGDRMVICPGSQSALFNFLAVFTPPATLFSRSL